MPRPNTNHLRLAVFIDADNVPAKVSHVRMAEITNHGKATIKRIYAPRLPLVSLHR